MKEIVDVQGQNDKRNLNIQKVGIKDVAYRGTIKFDNEELITQGTCDCYVFLSKDKKGTHMSRMARAISSFIDEEITLESLEEKLFELKDLLEADSVYFDIYTIVIRKKQSPISGFVGFESFKLKLFNKIEKNTFTSNSELELTGTSLCPASKTNSKYGAHNQRSVVNVNFPFTKNINLKLWIETIESSLSCIVYPILKLDDEAFITEKAYENPKFVEDIVRDLSVNLNEKNLKFNFLTCENFESIHTHNAYAYLSSNE